MKRRPRYLTQELADKLRLAHPRLDDPDASRVWGLLHEFGKWTAGKMPLQDHEGILVARVIT